MCACIIIPFILPVVVGKDGKNAKQQALTCNVGGEPGFTKRNQHFLSLIEIPWEGANTIASLFELGYQQYSGKHLLGTRELIKQETELSKDGKAFEKLTLGNYKWVSYGQALQHITNFASGLVGIGRQKGERVAIFSETRAEWMLALQTEVTTVVCDCEQL